MFSIRELMVTLLPTRGPAVECTDGCSLCCTQTINDPTHCDGGVSHPDCTMASQKEDLGQLRPADLAQLRTFLNVAHAGYDLAQLRRLADMEPAEYVQLHGAIRYALARVETETFEQEWSSMSAREINELEERLRAALDRFQEGQLKEYNS
jgi:hypothetical protein